MTRYVILVVALTLLIAIPALAGDEIARLQDDNGAPLKVFRTQGAPQVISGLELLLPGQTAREWAASFNRRYRELLLPGDSMSQLVVRRVVQSPLGPVVQMEQFLDGDPVWGKSLVSSFDAQARLRTVVNGTTPLVGLTRHQRVVEAAEAARMALEAFSGLGQAKGPARVKTVWLTGPSELIHAQLATVQGRDPLGEYSYLIIDDPGRIVFAFRRTPMATGYAYPQNPERDSTWQEVDLPFLTSDSNLTGEHVQVFNCTGSASGSCATHTQLATPDADGNYLIEPTGDDDPDKIDDRFVEVQAYYGINAIRQYFTAIGADPSPIKVGVNYMMPYSQGPNAYYTSQDQDLGGPSVIMGQWTNVDLALDNDIIFHEYGHHVFGEFSSAGFLEMDQYGPVMWGMAFNEATADYFSCSALEDPIVGEYFAAQVPALLPKGYLRTLDNELTCPEGLYGEGHDDGMIWSGFVWDVRQLLGEDQVDPLYLDVISHFPQSINFPSATEVFMARAELVFDEPTMQQIRDLAQNRGIADCVRFLEISRGGHTGFAFGKDLLGQYGSMLPFVPAALHYYLELPQNADRFELNWNPTAAADTVLLVRANTPVEHSISMVSGLSSTYDFMLEQGGIFDLSASGGQFSAGTTYYFHPASRGGPNSEYSIQGGYTITEPDGGTDGGTDGGSDGGTDGGVDGGDDCPPGTEPAVWEGQPVCVPVCKSGFSPKFVDDSWTCVKASSDDCGCAAAGSATGLVPLGLLLGLSWFLRRRRSTNTQ